MAIVTSQIIQETDLIGTLVNSQLTATGLTAYVSFIDSKTGEARTPQSTTLEFTIDKDNERSETILCTSHSTSSGITTLIIAANGRNLPKYGTGDGSGTGLVHDVGAKIGCVNIARPLNQLAAQAAAKNGDTFTGNITFSGTDFAGLVANTLTTTQRDALVGVEGMIIKNSTTGELNQFIGGAWSAVASGSTQPNASTTVAGKVEIATDAELAAGTNTGGTGAILSAAGGSFTATPTANKVPVATSSTTLSPGWIGSQDYAYVAAGEAVDGSTTPQLVFISDGTNSKTAGAFYKADADDTTNVAFPAVGFITENASSVGTSYYIKQGIITGFSGLTAGRDYYASTTAGAITLTQSFRNPPIGRAISTSAILMYAPSLLPISYAQAGYGNVTSGNSTNVDVYTGFKPRGIRFTVKLSATGTTTNQTALDGLYDVVGNIWGGNLMNTSGASGGTLVTSGVISSISDFTASGVGGNACTMTMTITVNTNYVRFTFTNTVAAGSGATGAYNITAELIP